MFSFRFFAARRQEEPSGTAGADMQQHWRRQPQHQAHNSAAGEAQGPRQEQGQVIVALFFFDVLIEPAGRQAVLQALRVGEEGGLRLQW